MNWISRSNRQFNDPTLLLDHGRCTGDIGAMSAASAAVRFVRRAQEPKS